jgi:hypothetical protein
MLVSQLVKCTGMHRAEDMDVLHCSSSSATTAGRGRPKEGPDLEKKGIQANCSHSQLDSQRALCLPKPLM